MSQNSQDTQEKKFEPDNSVKILELTIGHTSWYWCHFKGEPTRIQLSFSKGRLLFGKKQIPVGVNLSDRHGQQWLLNAPLKQRKLIRTVKVMGEMGLELLEMTPNLQALECDGIKLEVFQENAQFLRKLKMLRASSISGLEEVAAFTDIAPGLRQLVVADCEDLTELKGLENADHLQKFELINCDNVWEIDPLGFCKSLISLVIRNCANVHTINPIGVLHGLQRLELSRCKQVKGISPLVELDNLRYLDLSDCPRLTDVSVISKLQGLRELHLFGCRNVKDLRPLYHMQNMERISLPPNVTDGDLTMFCIAYKKTLEELDLRNCTELQDISPLKDLEKVKSLKLSGCVNIESIEALEALTNLVTLDLADCKNITDLEPLFGLENLKNLYVGGCEGLDGEQIREFDRRKPQCNVHSV